MKTAVTLVHAVFRVFASGLAVCLLSWMLVECAPSTSAARAAIASGAIAPGDMQTSAEVRSELISQVAEQFDL